MARRTRTTRTTARPKATISRGKKRRFTTKQKEAIAAAIGTLAAAGVGVAAAKRYFKPAEEMPQSAKAAVSPTLPQASSVQARSNIHNEAMVPLSSSSPTASTAKREAKREASRAAMVANAAAGNACWAYVQSEAVAAADRGAAKGKKIEKAVTMVQRRHRYNSTRKTTAARTIQKIQRGKSVREAAVNNTKRIEELEKRLQEAYNQKNICSTQKINNKSKTQKRARNKTMRRYEREIETITSLLKVLKK